MLIFRLPLIYYVEFLRDQYSDLYYFSFTCIFNLILLVNFLILPTIYADDIQLIIKIPVNSLNSNLELLECASEIINWLLRNYLLVNTFKTVLLNVSRVYANCPPAIIAGRVIHPYTSVCNLGVIFDSTLSFDAPINSISKSANFHLRRIGHIRKYCSKRITKLLINDLVLSRIDYCGSLFSDLKNIEVNKIDRIIRASIRLINNINRSEHLKTYEHQHNLKCLLFRKR